MTFPAPSASKQDQELGPVFAPKFDSQGLVTAVTVDHTSKAVLMVAHMNAQAIEATLESGYAHYWSRSRQKLWKKGESSGELQKVAAIYTDCDQDALVLEVDVEGAGSACHNGFRSCFYRLVQGANGDVALARVAEPLVDPANLYGRT